MKIISGEPIFKIKPLEWAIYKFADGSPMEIAETIFGIFKIEKIGDVFAIKYPTISKFSMRTPFSTSMDSSKKLCQELHDNLVKQCLIEITNN